MPQFKSFSMPRKLILTIICFFALVLSESKLLLKMINSDRKRINMKYRQRAISCNAGEDGYKIHPLKETANFTEVVQNE